MIAFALTTSHTTLLLGLAYVVAGAGVASHLSRKGHPAATAISALALWPLLLNVDPSPQIASGPLAKRIREHFAALERTLADPAADGVPLVDDLQSLRDALTRADERLGLADRVLADVSGEQGASLRDARDRDASEIEAVLDGVTELRVKIGMLALSGNTEQVRAELDGLLARAGALEELAELRA